MLPPGETSQDARSFESKYECNLLNQQGTCRLSWADFITAAQAGVSVCLHMCVSGSYIEVEVVYYPQNQCQRNLPTRTHAKSFDWSSSSADHDLWPLVYKSATFNNQHLFWYYADWYKSAVHSSFCISCSNKLNDQFTQMTKTHISISEMSTAIP